MRGLVEDDFRFKARLSVDGKDASTKSSTTTPSPCGSSTRSYIAKFTSRSGGDSRHAGRARGALLGDRPQRRAVDRRRRRDRSRHRRRPDRRLAFGGRLRQRRDLRPRSTSTSSTQNASTTARPKTRSRVRRRAPVSHVGTSMPPEHARRRRGRQTGQATRAWPRRRHSARWRSTSKNGRVVQIREKIAAKFDLLDKFRNYIERQLAKKGGDAEGLAVAKAQIGAVEDQPGLLEALLNFALNQRARPSRARSPCDSASMKYEFLGHAVKADLPTVPKSTRQGVAGVLRRELQDRRRSQRRQVPAPAKHRPNGDPPTAPDHVARRLARSGAHDCGAGGGRVRRWRSRRRVADRIRRGASSSTARRGVPDTEGVVVRRQRKVHHPRRQPHATTSARS